MIGMEIENLMKNFFSIKNCFSEFVFDLMTKKNYTKILIIKYIGHNSKNRKKNV